MTSRITDRHIRAEPVADGSLTDAQVGQWRSAGYVFVRDLVSGTAVQALIDGALAQFPRPGSPEAERIADFGSGGALTFPSSVPGFNAVTLDPNLLRAVAQLLGIPIAGLRLSQSDLWPKYGRATKTGIQDNSDQRIHVDYPNHTLAHPSPWHRPEAVELILYLSDWRDTGGATAVVPREGPGDPAYRWPIVDSPGIGDLDYVNDREAAEAYFARERPALAPFRELHYARERYTVFEPGDIIFYRHDTWHRGTPMTPGQLRLAHNMTFRRAEAEWISTLHTGWAWSAYRRDKMLERLIATSSLDQRAVLGFPQPGNPYWCEETIAAVEARYGVFGMDMTPYRQAMAG